MVTAVAVAVVGLTLTPPAPDPAQAAVVQWGTNSGTAPNYQANVNGDFLMAGNGVLACSATIGTTNNGTCADLHAASSSNANNVNDNFIMSNSNTVAGFTTNSSSATVTIPSGATVVKAFLSWSANTGVYTGDTRVLCSQYSAARGVATLPAGGATGYTSRAVQFRVGSGAVANVAPQSMLADPTSQATALYYSASADVTSAFAGATTGSPVTVSAGNIWTPTGAGCYAGWSLNVVYDYGTYIPDNAASIPHRVIFYEGHVRQGSSDPELTVAFNGFTAVAAGTRAGFTLFEGDRNITGDVAAYNRGGSTAYAEIPNSAGATGNFGIGRAVGSVRYTGTAGTAFTNQSVDVTTASLTNVVAGDTTVNLRLGTQGDSYLLRNAMLSVPTAGLQVLKSFDGTRDTQSRTASETATFTIRITNTGAGTLRNIVVTDDQQGCARTLTGVTLAPQQSTTYTCTAAAPSATGYETTADATAYTVAGNYLATDSDSTVVLLSAITLSKTSALAPGATGRAGDVLTYTFTVTNSGQSTLTNIVLVDPLPGLSAITFGTWPGAAGTLTAGQSVTATATYTLRQSDVDAGSIANTASVTASDPDGGTQPSGSGSRTTPIVAAPVITVGKTGALADGATGRVGDRVNYTFTFSNTGNVTLTNASLVDPLPGLSPPVVTWPTSTPGTLPAGSTATATAFTTITQADVDAGSIRNTATVTARTPAGASVTGTSPQVTVATIAQAPGLSTTKSGTITSGTGGVGSTITYSFRASNTGNTTLSGVSIADPLANLSALTYAWPGAAGTLAPGQSVTATATYRITQADVDAGSVRNTATGTATTPAGTTLSALSAQSTVATVAAAPALTLSKSGALAAGSTGRAGDVVTYSFSVANSGNVTLTGVGITDPLPGLSALTFSWPGTPGTLAPGQTVTATATYTLRQSDVDAGSVVNTATATGTPPSGARVTQSRSATVAVAPTGTLVVLKSGSVTSGNGGVGSTVTYTFSARNTGNVTLTQVALVDPLAGLSAIAATWPGASGTLAPGQTVTGTATYTIRQSDVDAGGVVNTATASGRPPAGATVTGSSPTTRVATAAAAPASTTTKSATVSGAGAVGDVVTYTVRTTNSGNVTLTGVAVTDPLPGLSPFAYSWPGTAGTLAPGQTVTATATYTLRQTDVNAGSVSNTASSTASFGATTVQSTSAAVVTPTAAAAPALVTTKSAALESGGTGRAGDTIVWTITLRNTGNVTLTDVRAADSLPGISVATYGTWPSGTAGTLQPGQTVTATATSVISQADVNAGAVSNTATGSGQPPTGARVSSTAPATLSLASVPGLTISKTGAVTSGSGGVGSTVTYGFTVRNTGNVTLTGVAVSDPLPGLSAVQYSWPGTAGTLQPDQQVTATATYTVRQADVDAGAVRNTATATGTPPTGSAVTASSGQVSVATAAAAPALTTTKSATGGGGGVGSTVTYSFRATNSGNVTLTGVAIADPLPGLGALQYSWPGAAGTLAPGQSVTAVADYTVTQADVNRGSITNVASASGTGGGATVSAASPSVVTPTVTAAPAIAVTKSGAVAGSGTVGDVVTFVFTVRNAGNVTLTGVGLADPLLAGAVTLTGWAGAAGTLQPGETVQGSATYTLRQSDVDAGAVVNTATATGQPPRGSSVSATGASTVPIAPVPSLAITKTGSVTSGDGGVGSTVTFVLTVRNSGNVTLTSVNITDTLAGLSAPIITWPGSTPNTLAPGQTATGTATYTVRQADVDAGSVRNTASVSGRPPSGPVVSATSTEAVVATAAAAPELTVGKSASPASGTAAGEVTTYTISVENTGNQTISGITISDPLPGLSGLAVTWPGTTGVLAPGQVASARGTYVVTQADVDAGSVANRATASGTAPGGVAVTARSAQLVTPTAIAAPALSFGKTASLPAGATGRAGDVVTYAFTLRNTGNVTLTGVGVTDQLAGLSAITFAAWPGAAGTLLPGQTVTATATRALTQADVDAGAVANTATATAITPSADAVERTAGATLALTAGPAVTLSKSGAYTSGTPGTVGSTITYSFVARNTGNVTLSGVSITDPHVGLGPIATTWPGAAGTLAPGQEARGTATYVVRQADVDAGSVTDTASVVGTPPTGGPVGASSAPVVLTTAAAGPSIATTKSATLSGTGAVGDVVSYTIVATNTGNVTLTDVAVTDTAPGLAPLDYMWPGTPNVLAPGAALRATTTHTITQADVDAGSLSNIATTTGTAPSGTRVAGTSQTVTTATAPSAPALAVTKSGALADGAAGVAGETITWTVQIRNAGNVTLSGITLADALPGMSDFTFLEWPGGTPGTLAPGATVTAIATSVVRQSDVDAGAVSNAATATGTPPRGQAASGTGSATVPLASTPLVTLDKTGAFTTGTGGVGSVITYTYTARNGGNVTLTGVTIVDQHAGLSAIQYGTWPSGTVGTLAPGQTVSATATYTVRQSDVNAGSISDTATVSGRPPTGPLVTATSPTVVIPAATATPAILTTKTAAVGGSGAVGDLITYTITARNTGNVTLTGVAISDPAPGLSAISYGLWPSAIGTLQPGEQILATATHRITQADVDAGSVTNTASSTGTPPTGPAVTDASDPVVATPAAASPDIAVSKSGALAPGATGVAGDRVAYAFTLRNTGNVTLTGVLLDDHDPGVSDLAYTWPTSTVGTLAPGQAVTATANYALTQADVDAGSVVNLVTGRATAPGGSAISEGATATVPIASAGALAVTKTGELVIEDGDTTPGEAGDAVRFDFTLRNTGNVTLSGVTIADSIPGLVPGITWPGPDGVLTPGQTATATADYTITLDDVAAGAVLNTATATGTPPSGPDVTATSEEARVATGSVRPELTTTKTGGLAVPGQGGVGDVVEWTIAISNTGNVEVNGIALADPLPGIELSEISWPDPARPGVIDPADGPATATATYTITQADVDRGVVRNVATATGTAAGAGAVSDASPESTVALDASGPAVIVTNTGSVPDGAIAGDTVTWTYTLLNDGNVTLSGVVLADAIDGVSAPQYSWPGAPGVLLPGESVTATATYELTQADIDAGSVVSLVTGTGTPPAGAIVSATAPATVALSSTSELSLAKTASETTGLEAGDEVTFTFVITNEGTSTIDGITLRDELPGVSEPDFGTWPGGVTGELAPGTSVTATATYTVTQGDVDAGFVVNRASTTGLSPSGVVAAAADEITLETVEPDPEVRLEKTASLAGDPADNSGVGDVVSYTFTVTNAGNTTLTGVSVTDDLPGLSPLSYGTWPSGETGVLAPGDEITATATYRIGQADVDAGTVTNSAIVGAVAPDGSDVSSDREVATTPIVGAEASIAVTKGGTLAAGSTGRAGDTVQYSFTARNTGDLTLSDVSFVDALPGLSAIAVAWPDAGAPGELGPGDVATATATYSLTQADVDAGAVANEVEVTATPARGALEPVSASDTVAIVPDAGLSAVKSGAYVDGGIGNVGDTIQYEVVVTNVGNVTVTNGSLVDPMPGLYDVTIAWPDPAAPGVLGVGENVTGRGKYDITQADVDAGFVENQARVAATTPPTSASPAGVRISALTNVVSINTVEATPGIAVEKTGTATGTAGVGDDVAYDFLIRNTGNVTLSGVAIADVRPDVVVSSIAWPDIALPGVLQPGETATATGVLEIEQADVDAGEIVNVATATGAPPAGPSVSATSPESVVDTEASAPALTVTNAGELDAGPAPQVGDPITWTYVLRNSGNVTLTGVTLSDALTGVSAPSYQWTTPVGVLAPGDSVTATATYALTQADIDAGSVTSLMTGAGDPPAGAGVSAAAPATVAVAAAPDLVVTKASDDEGAGVGDTVTYDFTLENAGNVTLSGVVLSDSLPGLSAPRIAWPGTERVLAPGQVATATATYTVTQADVDAGSFSNTATARALAPDGSEITATSETVDLSTEAAAPEILTTKSAVLLGDGGVGDIIRFEIGTLNAGNVTLTGVTGYDVLQGISDIEVVWPGEEEILLPGQRAVATAIYAITQADVDAGFVRNTATSVGTTPDGEVISDDSPAVVTPTIAAAPDFDITKDGALEAGATGAAGDVVDYTFSLTNTGNVTLTDVTFTDDLEGLSDIDVSWPADAGELAPGATATAVASVELTQADVDLGRIENTVTGSATPPSGVTLTREASATVEIEENAELTTVKSGEIVAPGTGQVGDTIEYTLRVTNTGNVTVQNGRLIDRLAGLSLPSIDWPGPEGELLVGDSVVGTATYRLQQADIDRGFVRNVAGVEATTAQGTFVIADSNPVVINTVQPAGALVVEKSGVVGGDGGVGSPIDFTFVIRNTGNVTVSGIVLDDPLPGLGEPVIAWPSADPARAGVLAPGESATATAEYTITQADVDAGAVVNAAAASGSARGGTVTSPVGTATVPTQGISASILVTKAGALADGALGAPGDLVTWTYSLRNTSNVSLTQVALDDRLDGTTDMTYAWPDPAAAGALAPGQEVTATATYAITQADIDRGFVSSVVDGVGAPPRGAVVTGTAEASAGIPVSPSLTVSKVGEVAGDGDAGDTIDYAFTIANTGNVTLTLVDLTDALAGVSDPEFIWPGEPGVLAPGQTVDATADYTITQADVDRGSVVNVATASGKPPVGDTISVTSPPSITAVAEAAPALGVTKTAEFADDGATGAVGDVVAYTVEVENIGNVTVGDVTLTDPLPGLSTPILRFPEAAGVLAPGQAATVTATYAITQADVDRGFVVNEATASGSSPSGDGVAAASGEVITPTAPAAPAVTLQKTGALEPGSTGQVGDLVDFAVVVTNTGNQTLTGISISDELPGLSDVVPSWPTATPGVLAPGESATATASYALTQEDIDAGAVSNAASVVGATAEGATVDAAAAATVEIPRSGALSAVKVGEFVDGGIGQVGDTIQYRVTVTNTGNVTVTNGSLVDPMPRLYDVSIAWPDPERPGVLEVGDSVTGMGKYDIVQADVDLGYVENTATVGATSPDGTRVRANTNTVRIATVLPAPGLAVVKTGEATGSGGVDDAIDYTFDITNTGNVTLDGVTLTDAMPGVSTPVVTWPTAGAPGVLAPGETATATATYEIEQADVDRGSVENIASASGTTPFGEEFSADSLPSVVETEGASPAVSVTNEGALAPGATGRAGDVVTWTYQLTNTGNVTLDGAQLVDALPLVDSPEYVWQGTPGVLVPGQSVTATAGYRLTQADVDAGAVSSIVTGSGTPEVGAAASATAAATVVVAPSPDIAFTKTAALARTGANGLGDIVDFDFRVENTGTVTLSDVAIVDELPGLGTIDVDWPGIEGELAPGEIATATATYAISQEDVDRGSVRNTATVHATTPTDVELMATSTIEPIPTVQHAPSISTAKSGALVSGDGGVGSVIEYTFDITNTGNVTLRLILVEEELEGVTTPQIDFPATTGILPPGGSALGVAHYTVTQADVDAGSITNVATSYGTSPRGVVVSGESAPFVIDTAPATTPSLAITTEHTAALATGSTGVLGDRIDYAFEITNTGNTTLTGVQLANTVGGLEDVVAVWPVPGSPGTLAPGQSVQYTATRAVTQADVDAGVVRNIATGSGTTARGALVTDDSSETVVDLAGAATYLTVEKTGALDADGAVGDEIAYAFTVTNPGDRTVTGIDLVDPLAGLSEVVFDAWPGATGTLAPGESVDATASYTITQADVDRGAVSNVATASGRAPNGDALSASSPRVVTDVAVQDPALTVTKTADYREDGATGEVGDVVEYSFAVENTGNVTIDDVVLEDPLAGLSTLDVGFPGDAGVLAPGEIATATATYTVTQADVDRGSVVNQATASGSAPQSASVVATSPSVVTPTVQGDAELSLDKVAALDAGPEGEPSVGDTVSYTFELANVGNQTLTGATLDDPLPGLSAIEYAWPTDTAGLLTPGASATATATYALAQSDIDAGAVSNLATLTALTPAEAVVTADDAVTLPIAGAGALAAVKSAAFLDGGSGEAGDTVRYEITATNTGNVTLVGADVIDPLPGLSELEIAWPDEQQPGVIAVGASFVATATYDLTQADVDRGFVLNTATAVATAPDGTRVRVETDAVRVDTVSPVASLEVSKSGETTGAGGADDAIDYAFTVTNTGNVTLTGVTLTDPKPGVSSPVVEWPTDTAPGVLAPGETATATATYDIEQADVDAGVVENVATVTASTPSGDDVSAESDLSVVSVEAGAPAVSVTNDGALAPGAVGRAGDVVTWTYVLTNVGSVTLSAATLADSLPGVGDPGYVWQGPVGVLVPGQSVTATATYALTQSDVDAGAVTSIVTGSGTPQVGASVSASAPATVFVAPESGLLFEKTAVLVDGGANGLGDAVQFGFRIENSGTVTLSGIGIDDALAGIGAIDIVWPGPAGQLAPGQVATGTAPYAISQADVDRGSVQNSAIVRATQPTGVEIVTSSTSVPIETAEHAPSLATEKIGAYVSGDGGVGSVIEYRIDVTNTGNVTLGLIAVVDELDGLTTPQLDFPGTTRTLAPGETVVATARYTVTQADVDAGSITNVASSSASSPRGVVVESDSAPFVIETAPATEPALSITTEHTAALAPGMTGVLGDRIDYGFSITNSGNTTLTGVDLANTIDGLENLQAVWPDPDAPGTLAPGQTVQFTAARTVTQADVDAGVVENVATGSGTTARGSSVTDDSEPTTVSLAAATASLAVAKSGAAEAAGAVGDVIEYSFTVTNTGTLSLSGVTLTDPLDGLSDVTFAAWPGAEGELAPGQSVSASASYVITQADVDAGVVRNVAEATATSARGGQVSASSPVSLVPTQDAAAVLDLEKVQDLAEGSAGRAGDRVDYTFTLTNTGNVTLTGVALSDDQPGLEQLVVAWPGEPGVLLPGQTAAATASVVLTQADVDAGGIESTATATGTGRGVVVSDADTASTAITASPSLSIRKSSEFETVPQQGAAILYTVTVANTGNVTLTDVAVTDDLEGLEEPVFAWPSAVGRLAPGEILTVSARYTITQADIDEGMVVNRADVSATAPDGTVLTGSDTEIAQTPSNPAISLAMDIALEDGAEGYAGDRLRFRYVAVNTGTATLTNVSISDAYPGLGELTYEWPGIPGVLLPGQSVTAVATVVITEGMQGTVVASRGVVTSVEAQTGEEVASAAGDAIALPTVPTEPGEPGEPTPVDPTAPGQPSIGPDAPEGPDPDAPIGGLPFTGADVLPIALAAGLLLAAGLVFFLVARTRRRETDDEDDLFDRTTTTDPGDHPEPR
jgi:uncharacterized repeat protein (TIGR01451 family)